MLHPLRKTLAGLRAAVVLAVALGLQGTASAGPVVSTWAQPGGLGSPLTLTYSYSNLLDGGIMGLTVPQILSFVEQSFQLWATYAPLHFVEVVDSGPAPSDASYAAAGHPLLRLGHHGPLGELAHAYYPSADGLGGDVHMGSNHSWSSPGFFLEVFAHEIGHSLGLAHSEVFTLPIGGVGGTAGPIMCAVCFHDFTMGGYLYHDDVAGIRAAYGAGVGSVTPLRNGQLPEPATLLLVALAVAGLAGLRATRPAALQRAG